MSHVTYKPPTSQEIESYAKKVCLTLGVTSGCDRKDFTELITTLAMIKTKQLNNEAQTDKESCHVKK